MGKHNYTKMDRARDELMSHVIRCDVFEADMEHRSEWLDETMGYMADRYPMLSDLELTQLEIMGRQFIKPPIPHGKGHTATTRDRNIDELATAENAAEPQEVDVTRDEDEELVGAGAEVVGESEAESEAETTEDEESELQAA